MSLLGQPIPPFALADDQGRTVTPATLAGAWTVIYAYPRDATPGCTTEACDFRDSWARVQAAGARVYGISKDSVASHQKFRASQELPFPLLADPDKTLLTALGGVRQEDHVRQGGGGDHPLHLPDRSAGGDPPRLAEGCRQGPCPGGTGHPGETERLDPMSGLRPVMERGSPRGSHACVRQERAVPLVSTRNQTRQSASNDAV